MIAQASRQGWRVESDATFLQSCGGFVMPAAHYADSRPELDDVSSQAISAPREPDHIEPTSDSDSADEGPTEPSQPEEMTPEGALWLALCLAPEDGADIGELMRVTGMSRPTLYRHLSQHAKAGRAVQVSRGRWRATITEEPSR